MDLTRQLFQELSIADLKAIIDYCLGKPSDQIFKGSMYDNIKDIATEELEERIEYVFKL